MSWNFGAPNSALLSDPRRDLPVFTFLPNWKDGITERLSWLTDILTSETGVEQRRSVRRYPRRTFEATILRADNPRSRLDMFLVGVGMGDFMFPIYHEQVHLGEYDPMLGTGVVQLPVGTMHMREWRLNDLVLIMERDPSDFDILTVVDTDQVNERITLQSAAEIKVWTAGCRIIPLRQARFTDFPQMSMPVDRVGQARVRAELVDPETFPTPDWNFDVPMWNMRPDRSEDVTLEYSRTIFEIDYGTGMRNRIDPGNTPYVGTKVALKLFGRERMWQYRRFLAAARGRAVRFYMPTFAKDVMPIANMDGLTIDVEDNGLVTFLSGPQDCRMNLGVVFADGRPNVYREIISALNLVSSAPPYRTVGIRITLDEAMPPITVGEVDRIMFIQPSRFDQDSFELYHYVDNGGAVGASFVTRSQPRGSLRPIVACVTSAPYTLEAIDDFTTDSEFTSGYFVTPPLDYIVTTAAFGNSVLSSTYQAFDAPIEYLTTSTLGFGTGTLATLYVSYTAPAEDFITTNTTGFGTGTLITLLISYTDLPIFSIQTSASLGNGTLA